MKICEKIEPNTHCHNDLLSCSEYNLFWGAVDGIRTNLIMKIYGPEGYYPQQLNNKDLPDILKATEIMLGALSGFPLCCCVAYAEGKSSEKTKHGWNGVNGDYILCKKCAGVKDA